MKQFYKFIKEKVKKLKSNHSMLMLICCVVPLVLLIIVINFFGLSKSYLSWFILLLCPIMHYFMMKDMHKNKKGKKFH